jgi:hypothetical protein
MRYLISVVGVLLALGFMAVSAVMNWRYGHALGRDPIDQYIYASTAIIGDIFKAMAPFFFWWAAKNRRVLVAVAAGVLWVVCTAYSLGSTLGYAAMNRQATAGTMASKADTFADLRAELTRKQERLVAFGAYDPPAAIESKLEGMRKDRLWPASQDCAEPTGKTARDFCTSYATAQAALARSHDAVRLEGEIADLRAKLQPLASASKTDRAGDPQASAVAHLTGWELVKVQTAFSLLLVALLELGSSLGLFISLNHGELSAAVRDHKAAPVATSPAPAPVRAKPAKPELVVVPPSAPAPVLAISPPVAMAAQPTGEVERFAYAKVEAFPGQSLGLDAIYGAYRQWCRAEGCKALGEDEFAAKFVKLAEIVGIAHKKRGRKVFCEDVALAS